MTSAYAVQYIETGVERLAAVRMQGARLDRLAGQLENKQYQRSETERAKIARRVYSVGGWELTVYSAFGMNNYTVRRNGVVVVKLATKAGR